MTLKYLLIGVALIVCVAGCAKWLNPETGEEVTVLSPEAQAAIDRTAEAAEKGGPAALGIAAIVAPQFIPIWTLVGLIGGVLVKGWRRLSPALVAAESRADQAEDLTRGIVAGVEDFKSVNPETWKSLGEYLAKKIGPKNSLIVKAVIDGLESEKAMIP